MYDAFGARSIVLYNYNFLIGGSLRVPGRTGFSPAMHHAEKAETFWTDTGDTQPFYSIDKMVRMDNEWRVYYMAMPRDSSYAMLKHSLHPILVGN